MTGRGKRVVAQAAWRFTVLSVLTLAAAWDAAGLLLGGDAAYTSPSYDVLRSLTPWGMRAYGPLLAVLLAVLVYAYGRFSAGRGYLLLRLCLSGLAGWYVLWAVGMAGAWWVHWQIGDWTAAGKLFLTAVVCLVLARTTPTERVTGG
ncbi:hypothetical protein JNW90_10520 [Micromonospora sp. STR1s_5]|nr:hypothetical protein [Micromonospora sp. STR1s_5]